MTGRGRAAPIILPRPDPTLETRPVPRERHYSVRSIGPGSAPGAREQFQSLEEVKQQANDTGLNPKLYEEEDIRLLLKLLTSEHDIDWREDRSRDEILDPTWGPTFMVTAYSENALKNLDQALLNLVEACCRFLFKDPRFEAYAQETFKRLRFDVIDDKDLLENASDDRIREEFNAHVRSLRLFREDLEDEIRRAEMLEHNLNRPIGPRRYDFCIAMGERTIEELALLVFSDKEEENASVLRAVSVKVIERCWYYPEEADHELVYGRGPNKRYYDGKATCPVYDLPWICGQLYDYCGLHEMFPLSQYHKRLY
ncbi:uncharacterized protein FIESC28_09205 [Fusarium coffeatum]|uniref:Uncharacterized protein n=1 Tax=Fusarium coffeatum TaxID=231269 RepID=A0A366R469_9HYPO|nr:uncharacterized protein FIESC28_09205 [Fusarium coffeatum]RBR11060.1 hypothetical protein FIESC28_09205 [Fusarium coffeatum]